MIRFLTAGLIVFLVACGGGSGGDNGPGDGSSPSLMSLFPVDSLGVGTDYTYSLMKTLTRTTIVGTKNIMRTCEIDRVSTAGSPDLHLIGRDGAANMGAGFMWTSRGLELTAYMQTTWWNTDGVCVTATTPGVLIVPSGFKPGDTHSCSGLGSHVDSLSITWVGPSAVTGHPDAHRFNYVATGPYSNSTPSHPRSAATSHTVSGSVFMSPGVGPVEGTYIHQFLNGTTVVEERKYEFTLSGVVPAP